MAASGAPAAITYMVNAFQTAVNAQPPNGYAMYVLRGAPTDDFPADEAIVVREVRRQVTRQEMVGGIQQGALREDLIIPVEIVVFRGGDNMLDVETRWWQLVNLVESTVRADRTLGGAVLDAWPETTDLSSEWTDLSTGRRAIGTVNIACWNSI